MSISRIIFIEGTPWISISIYPNGQKDTIRISFSSIPISIGRKLPEPVEQPVQSLQFQSGTLFPMGLSCFDCHSFERSYF
jgi:hypothetical protein